MFLVFRCKKCGHLLYVYESGCPQKLGKIAGKSCPNCREQGADLWDLLGRAKKFKDTPMCEWEE